MITNFHDKKMLKEKAPCKCLSLIMLDSVIKTDDKYKKKKKNYIDDDLEESDYNDETESDNDNDEDDEDDK